MKQNIDLKQAATRRWRRVLSIGLAITIGLLLVVAVIPNRPRSEILEEMNQSMAKHKDSIRKHVYVILVDYDLPVFMRRLWVIERDSGEIIINAHVSHGRKSRGTFFYVHGTGPFV